MKTGIVLVALAGLVGAVLSQEIDTTPEVNPLCSSERQRVLIWRAQYLLQQLKECLDDPTEAPTLEPITTESSPTETETTTDFEDFSTTTFGTDFDTESPTTQGPEFKIHRSRVGKYKKNIKLNYSEHHDKKHHDKKHHDKKHNDKKHHDKKHHDKKHNDKKHHDKKHHDKKHHDKKHQNSKSHQNHKGQNKA